MQGTGNINYSFNKNDFIKIMSGTLTGFLPFYFFVVIISVIYLYTIRFQRYFFPDRDKGYQTDDKIIHFFKSLSIGSPFNILEFKDYDNNDKKFVGLTYPSYLKLIITYIITLIIIIEGLVRNLIYSVYSNFIQINSNNNPYNNPTCITKINENPNITVSANYSGITSLSFSFLIPFVIPFLIHFMKFDNYDIKHNSWFKYVVLFLIFYPFIILIITRASFKKKLDIFPALKKFLNTQDYNFVDQISKDFSLKTFSYIIFIFIIFIFCFYTIIYSEFRYELKNRIIIYSIIVVILLIFIPVFIIFFVLSFVLNNKNIQDGNEYEIIESIQKNGISGVYDLLVKYNYPCFLIK